MPIRQKDLYEPVEQTDNSEATGKKNEEWIE
jgi:hypothetical protein